MENRLSRAVRGGSGVEGGCKEREGGKFSSGILTRLPCGLLWSNCLYTQYILGLQNRRP